MDTDFNHGSTPPNHVSPAEQMISRIGGFALFLFLIYIVSDLSSMALIRFGNAQFAAGNARLGTGSYVLALELKPALKRAVKQCDADVRGHNNKLAIEHCGQAIKLNRFHAAAHYGRGLAFHNLAQQEQAIADFTQALDQIPNFTWARVYRGISYVAEGHNDRAIADCSQAVEAGPNDVKAYAYFCLGLADYGQENYDRALKEFDLAIEAGQADPGVYFFRGSIHDKRGEEALAIADYTKTIELDPKYADAYLGRGNALADSNQFAQAIADYEKALGLYDDPKKEAYTYCVQGVTYLKMNDIPSARAALEQGVKLDSTSENDWCKSILEAMGHGISFP